jgi:N-acetylglucosamine-6-sulfatase
MQRGGSILLVVGALLAGGCGGGDEGPAPDEQVGREEADAGAPNIVVVMTDDQGEDGWRESMPRVDSLIARPGAVFENSFATTPLCCPSRATYITGEYAHNHGVEENYPGYPDLREPGSVLPEWLRRAGYTTAHVGKWLHGYERLAETQGGSVPPPGWDEWYGLMRAAYYNYEVSVNGQVESYAEGPGDHADEVITRYGMRFLRSAAGERPFFLSLAYLAPHTDKSGPDSGGTCAEAGFAVPGPGDVAVEPLDSLPVSPALNEVDVSDKPPFVAELPQLAAAELDELRLRIACERAALRVVDRGVAELIAVLRRTGELSNTVLIFTSDHGYLHGEHRIDKGKSMPYDPAVRVPLAIRTPRSAPAAISGIAANIDLAPTILDYAGAEPCLSEGECRALDGQSLRPLVESGRGTRAHPRAILLESTKRSDGICAWQSVRTEAEVMTEYRVSYGQGCGDRELELYDSRRDPDELENLADDPAEAARLDRMIDLRKRLVRCAGADCR